MDAPGQGVRAQVTYPTDGLRAVSTAGRPITCRWEVAYLRMERVDQKARV